MVYSTGKHYRHLFPPKRGGKPLCTFCNAESSRVDHLFEHLKTHTREKPYFCIHCGKELPYLHTWKSHTRSCAAAKLRKSREFRCSLCQRLFKRLEHLETHLKSHLNERPYKCEICSKAFKSKEAVKSHMNSHDEAKKHKCQECKKNFKAKSSLRLHVKTIHKQLQKHVCPICDKAFTQKTNLTAHMSVHTGEKPYRCNECQKCFSQSYLLKRHVKQKHF